MPGGTLSIAVPTYAMLKQVAAAVTCWAGGPSGANVRQIGTTTNSGPSSTAIVIPEALWSIGALALKRGGANILTGLPAGSHSTYFAGNGLAMDTDANTCPARTNEPTITSFTTNVAGVPTDTSLVYANVAAAGTVSIDFGDGTILTGQAEAATVAHSYPNRGVFVITITDESVPANTASATVVV